MARIGVLARSFCHSQELRELALQTLSQHSVSFYQGNDIASGEQLESFLSTKDGAIIGREQIDDALLNSCPNLKILSLYGVGHDNIQLDAVQAKGIEFFWKPGVNAAYAAELTLGMMISLSRKMHLTSRQLHQGEWHKDGGSSLLAKSVGIVGVGHVGGRVARMLSGLGVTPMLHDIKDVSGIASDLGAPLATFNEVLNADLISLHVPLTSSTRGMVSAQVLGRLKAGAIVINTCRGEVWDEQAVLAALNDQSAPLSSVGVDVWANEPHIMPELSMHKDVLGTPHVGGNARESVTAMGKAALEGITNYFS